MTVSQAFISAGNVENVTAAFWSGHENAEIYVTTAEKATMETALSISGGKLVRIPCATPVIHEVGKGSLLKIGSFLLIPLFWSLKGTRIGVSELALAAANSASATVYGAVDGHS